MKLSLPVFILTAILAAFCPTGPARAVETVYTAAGLSNALDNDAPSARVAALGSAGVALTDDAGALAVNPAGLAWLKNATISLDNNFWVGETLQETFLLAIPTSDLGGFALSGNYFNYGKFDGRDESGNLTTGFSANRLSLGVGWGLGLGKNAALGLGLKGTQSDLASNSYTALVGNLGLLVKLFDRFRLGIAYNNASFLSPAVSTSAAFNLGLSYEIPISSSSRLLAVASGTIEPLASNYLQAGLEYGLFSQFFLRAGYQQPLTDNGIGGLTGLSAGLGLVFSGFVFDYAFLPYGDVGSAHRVTLGFQFDPGKPASVPSPASKAPALSPAAPPLEISKAPPSVSTPTEQVPEIQPNSASKESLMVQFDLPPDVITQGKELEKQGRNQEAIQLYMDVVKKNNQDALAWKALGDAFYKMDPKTYKVYVINCFERVLSLQPQNKALAQWLEQYKSSKP